MNEERDLIVNNAGEPEAGLDSGREFPQLDGLPESVKIAFFELPPEIQNRIFPPQENEDQADDESGLESEPKRNLERIVSCLDTKSREWFLLGCFSELFMRGKFKEAFLASGQESLSTEISRFLELVWQNRGRRGDDVEIFNQSYYDDFLAKRNVLTDELKAKMAEVNLIKESIERNRRKRGIVRQKQQQLESLQQEFEEIKKRLKVFDEKNENTLLERTSCRDVSGRQDKEERWTEALVITAEYYKPDEFAAAAVDGLEAIFHREVWIAQGKPAGRQAVSNEAKARAKDIYQAINDSIDTWHSAHQNESSYKKPVVLKNEVKAARMIDYLQSVIQGYFRQKDHYQRPQEELLVEVRQIEVCLNVLKKQLVE